MMTSYIVLLLANLLEGLLGHVTDHVMSPYPQHQHLHIPIQQLRLKPPPPSYLDAAGHKEYSHALPQVEIQREA